LEAFFLAGDTGTLRQVLKTETDPEMRAAAIQALAVSDDDVAAEYLFELLTR
jgi:hypothetical protein